ncbi:hypothetical protein CDIK_3421 [Cucumispora dikerogammari]|nr:hypothetical protein CDIK_3421 [Cucumispora dikerogammari]
MIKTILIHCLITFIIYLLYTSCTDTNSIMPETIHPKSLIKNCLSEQVFYNDENTRKRSAYMYEKKNKKYRKFKKTYLETKTKKCLSPRNPFILVPLFKIHKHKQTTIYYDIFANEIPNFIYYNTQTQDYIGNHKRFPVFFEPETVIYLKFNGVEVMADKKTGFEPGCLVFSNKHHASLMLYMAIFLDYEKISCIKEFCYIFMSENIFCDQTSTGSLLSSCFEICLDLDRIKKKLIGNHVYKDIDNHVEFKLSPITNIRINKIPEKAKLKITLQATKKLIDDELCFEVSRCYTPSSLKKLDLLLDAESLHNEPRPDVCVSDSSERQLFLPDKFSPGLSSFSYFYDGSCLNNVSFMYLDQSLCLHSFSYRSYSARSISYRSRLYHSVSLRPGLYYMISLNSHLYHPISGHMALPDPSLSRAVLVRSALYHSFSALLSLYRLFTMRSNSTHSLNSLSAISSRPGSSRSITSGACSSRSRPRREIIPSSCSMHSSLYRPVSKRSSLYRSFLLHSALAHAFSAHLDLSRIYSDLRYQHSHLH